MKGKTKMKTTTNTYVVNSGTESPQAWVAIKRNRQKIYNGQGKSQVYLKDGQEFQIELFNPTQSRYLVKFKINGNYSSDRGLILNPGQRYFLDRFIDEDRKLAFSTYEIEDSKAAKKAIEKNGLLEVEFYSETFLHGNIISYPKIYNTPNWSQPIWTTNPSTFWYGTSNGISNNAGGSSTLTLAGSTINNVSYTSGTVNCGTTYTSTSNYSSVVNDASIETGRVEKGEKSDQKFEEGYGTFGSWASYTTTVQIIPLSQKPAEAQEIRSYCTGCGSRIKKQTWKFCPNCGTEAN
jgi:hypothetical protein